MSAYKRHRFNTAIKGINFNHSQIAETQMEIEGEDGSKIKLQDASEDGSGAVFGRGSGFNTDDRTVSRRHVLFQLFNNQTEPRVSFRVIGRNPVWLRGGGDGERKKIRVFRKLDEGEMEAGDCFCISSQSPVWYILKKIEVEGDEDLGDDNGSDRFGGNSGSLDVSEINPVKEFGFLVIGHEFDSYPKQRIRNPKNWDWFLEETKRNDDGDDEKKSKRSRRRKRKKHEDDDEEWTDESEDIETTASINKAGRPKYSTRSKDKGKGKERKSDRSRMNIDEEEEDDDDEDDEDDDTLGGFIVKDDDDEEGGGGNDEEEEEEEEEEELMEDEEELDE